MVMPMDSVPDPGNKASPLGGGSHTHPCKMRCAQRSLPADDASLCCVVAELVKRDKRVVLEPARRNRLLFLCCGFATSVRYSGEEQHRCSARIKKVWPHDDRFGRGPTVGNGTSPLQRQSHARAVHGYPLAIDVFYSVVAEKL